MKENPMPRSMMIAWVLAVFTFSGARSEAELMVVETTTELVGLTSVTVQTGFQETEYTLGDPILLTVDWQSSPIAMFDGIELKRKGYTPIAKRGNRGGDPAEGTEPGSVSWMSNSSELRVPVYRASFFSRGRGRERNRSFQALSAG